MDWSTLTFKSNFQVLPYWKYITRHIYIFECNFLCFSFSSASVYYHLFHPHNNHLSPNSPRLMFLFVKCATVNKVYLILSLNGASKCLKHVKEYWFRCVHWCYFWMFMREKPYFYQIWTHWDQVTHTCVSKLSILGSDNGLSPGRRQAII